MDQIIIGASGTAADVCEKLKVISAIFPKGATLAEVATATRRARLEAVERQQFEEIERGAEK
jgi:hypothetical protein